MDFKRTGDPVNKIVLPYDTIKAYDMDTTMTLDLYNEDVKADVDDITFFILSNSVDEYVNVEDYSVKNGTVTFKMPKVDTDKYYPQIMDRVGRVYSSADTHFIDVVYNRESRVNELFPVIKKEVIEKVTPAVKQFVMDNREDFSIEGKPGIEGPEGPEGPQGPRGFQGNRGVEGLPGLQGEEGPEGPQGPRGFQGNRGLQGPTGNIDFEALTPEQMALVQGEEGPQGPKGEDGSVVFEELTTEQLNMLSPDISFELDPDGNLFYEVNGGV